MSWYIASSVYEDELRKSSQELHNRIIKITFLIMMFSLLVGYFFMRRLINPIRRLSEVTTKVKEGDLSVRSNINRSDEIGVLSESLVTI